MSILIPLENIVLRSNKRSTGWSGREVKMLKGKLGDTKTNETKGHPLIARYCEVVVPSLGAALHEITRVSRLVTAVFLIRKIKQTINGACLKEPPRKTIPKDLVLIYFPTAGAGRTRLGALTYRLSPHSTSK